MRIRYLGTAAAEGWPGIFCQCEYCRQALKLGGKNIRTRSQAIIDDALLVDFPPDSYLHMLRDGLRLPDIRDILITHTHQDHFYPDELLFRCGYYASGVEEQLTLYGNDTMNQKLARFIRENPERAIIGDQIAHRELTEFVPAAVGGYQVTPLLARHDRDEKCFIYEIEKGGKRLLYGNDTGIFPAETWKYLENRRFDLVSLDCTLLCIKEGTNHMGIEDVLEVRRQLEAIGCADNNTIFVITHFSHNGRLLHDEIVRVVTPQNILVAYDGLTVEF